MIPNDSQHSNYRLVFPDDSWLDLPAYMQIAEATEEAKKASAYGPVSIMLRVTKLTFAVSIPKGSGGHIVKGKDGNGQAKAQA